MATHSCILAWEISRTEEPGRLQSMGLQRVRHDLATKHHHHPDIWIKSIELGRLHSPPLPSPHKCTLGSFKHKRRACIRCLLSLSLFLVLVGLPYSPEWCYGPRSPHLPLPLEWPLQAHFRTTSSPAPLTPSLPRCCWLPWLQFLLVALALNRLLLPLPHSITICVCGEKIYNVFITVCIL